MPNPLISASVSVGFETLRANPLRTLLSTLGIVIGVAALVSVLSVGDGIERFARAEIERTTDFQTIAVAARTFRIIDGTPFPVANPATVGIQDVEDLQKTLGAAIPVNMTITGVSLVTIPNDAAPHAAQVMGVLVPDERLADSLLIAGRAFTAAEAKSGAPVVVISDRLAKDLATARRRSVAQIIGDTLVFRDQARWVIGVMKDVGPDRTRRAGMPYDAATAVIASVGPARTPSVSVKVPRVEDVAATRARVETWAASRYGAAWNDRLNVMANESRIQQLSRSLLIFKIFMGALMSISLIVGGIGIMNVLLSSVIERTREIGIRKAAGAAQRHILWQFLSESVAITGVGSLIGLVLGVGAAFLTTAIMRRFANAPVHAWLSPSTIAVAIGASVLIGLSFGLYPAMRAARLSPIDAIHHE